jgi:DNA-binding NarL/FixJ family response regulator
MIVCFSSKSVSKEGYVQKEIRFGLDIALEKKQGSLFIIPLRLDECQPPSVLRQWQYVDYFPDERKQSAYRKIINSLEMRRSLLSYFDCLSQKEKSVLLLVSEGKTNREIAKALFLGEGTVRNYVSSILAKLGLNNRAEAAAYAVEHDLRTYLL